VEYDIDSFLKRRPTTINLLMAATPLQCRESDEDISSPSDRTVK